MRDVLNRDDEITLVNTRAELCGVASKEEIGALIRKKYGTSSGS